MNSTAYLLFLCFMVSASKRKTGWSVTCFWSMEFLWVANQPRVASNQWTSPSQSARSPSIVQRDASLLIKDGGCLCMSRRAFDSVVMWKGKLTQKTVGREFCDNLHSLPKNVISGQHFTCAITACPQDSLHFSHPQKLWSTHQFGKWGTTCQDTITDHCQGPSSCKARQSQRRYLSRNIQHS